jgi:hypothetical protein
MGFYHASVSSFFSFLFLPVLHTHIFPQDRRERRETKNEKNEIEKGVRKRKSEKKNREKQ